MRQIRIFLFLIAISLLNIGVAQEAVPTDTTASLKRGCYASYQEFLNNNPSIVDSFYVDKKERKHSNWIGTFNYIPKYAGKKYKVVKHIWGFCDDEKVYVFHQREFFLISSDSIGHYFTGYNIIDHSDIPLSAAAAYAMGNSGGAEAIILDKAKSVKVEYKIDLHTGWALHPNPKYNAGKPVETVVFYRGNKKEKIQNYSILLNDTMELNFVPNSYNSIKLLSGIPEVKICQGDNFTACRTYTLNLEGIDYFKLSIPEKTGDLEMTQVPESEGEYYSFKAMKAQEKRQK